MKLSLAWIFDHLDADWRHQDIERIYALFNKTTAEMESFHHLKHDLKTFFMGLVTGVNGQTVSLSIPELGKTVELKGSAVQGGVHLLKQAGDCFGWATHADFGGEKEGALPAFDVAEVDLKGTWRNQWQADDIIIEVDNKSITHRPDMWSHRGFAREIGAFLEIPLKPAASFLASLPVSTAAQASPACATQPVAISIDAPQGCSRFTGLYLDGVVNKPCNVLMASRLLNIGGNPRDGVVDATNYLMQDWGQPVHAYDAQTIDQQQIHVRMAREGEKMRLLGDVEISLTPADLVIADATKPLCLAGVKGGANSGITAASTAIFFEAATFDAGTIRRSAQRHKMRTDSSARFEKTLDPELTAQACQRFVNLLTQAGLAHRVVGGIVQVGAPLTPKIITMTHTFLESRVGMPLDAGLVVKLLTNLEFGVSKQGDTYTVTVPSFRASKDVAIKEDLVEEVVRCIGFDKIIPQLPLIIRTPFSTRSVQRVSAIKHYFVRAVRMTEQQNYALADSQFLAAIGYQVAQPATLMNPISEHFATMVTSLVPGLLKNIVENHVHRDQLRFFECGRIWPVVNGAPKEVPSVAGIYFAKRGSVDFYAAKDDVINLLRELGFAAEQAVWSKATDALALWYHPFQTAHLTYQGQYIGVLGKVNPAFVPRLSIDTACDMAIFELDGEFLQAAPAMVPRHQPLSRFQDTYIDLSMLVPLALPAAQLVAAMRAASGLITTIEQVDCFENSSWHDVRALTYRLWLSSHERTLEKHDIDVVWNEVTETVKGLGAQLRV